MTTTPITSAKKPADLLKLCETNNIEFVDFMFADLKGALQKVTFHISQVDKDLLENGMFFDGSSISGWKAINESDMLLKPDISHFVQDPFSVQPTLKVFCDVHEPLTGEAYERCPRQIAKKTAAYLQKTGIADKAYFGPEPEFFIFDSVKVSTKQNKISFEIDSEEMPHNSDTDYAHGNSGHRPGPKGGYFPDAPLDTSSDLRSEMLSVLSEMGMGVEKHHHEVAPAQSELGITFDELVACANNTMLYKYTVQRVAQAYGKTATFMPKPMYQDNGSGMHVHQSLFDGDKALFAGDEYAGLSETCLYYIGGLIKHARALNAFTNPTTNSYKRLVPGYEAPVILAYSARNRSASCRIPMVTNPKARRLELRFPDPMANPYLAFSAMLLAGLDGIKNKIHPGEAMDDDLYALSKEELSKVPQVCGSLREALDSLKDDHAFLMEGDCFTKDMIEGYIDLKMEEVDRYEQMPHPVEFDMYYSS